MLKVSVDRVEQVAKGVWFSDLPPHQVRMFGNCDSASGTRSVILLNAAEFDPASESLMFEVEDATVLNVGSSANTLVVLSRPFDESLSEGSISGDSVMSRGDREFLEQCRSDLPDHMNRAASALLAGVRARSPGELKRGQSGRNFSDTPDNFWYVIVQPRVEQLSITVRGPVETFDGATHLPVKDDRGNTLFKVSGEQDVDAALNLIFRAKRKR
ncbi:hypothetical protein [Breoghania sp.]|uniref:hypothetical protein n=1 Tax=Breoghania sp. TaxID=2065378 RepID=UPI002AA77141|nr:hypothetical protein [Breoghania sp.]